MAELLGYEKLVVLNETSVDSAKTMLVLCSKGKDGVKIHMDSVDAKHMEFLNGVGAKGTAGETYVYLGDDKKMVVFVGLGSIEEAENELELKNVSRKAGALAYKAVSHLNDVEIALSSEMMCKEVVSGIVLASYKYDFLDSEEKKGKKVAISCKCPEISKAITIANAQNFARFLGDTPANLMNPTLFVEYASKYLGQKKNVKMEVYDQKFMKESGMNLLLSVAQGSVQEPKFVVAKYRGRGGESVDVSLVGKGVCFDSGGISLKPSAKMNRMKGDMLGAASVLSVIGLASDLGVKMNVDIAIPLVENMPSGTATKPGDVYVGMNGKSVEIDNTDAEGRLILADALVYAQKANPSYIFDVATLTGAICVALGDTYMGYFTKDDELSSMIYQSGIEANDPAWRMPLSKFYLPLMKSNVADLKNTGESREAGSSTAAIFLNEFVDKKFKWAHFDIAGVSESNGNKAVFGESITGCSVPILIEIIEKLSQKIN
ncbi:cytosol aminopeptidase [Ordospora pajunii]|uniref:cytosol aminopeptidase n=1 Tax=Ordospora pajunii TaxID=3039483 RepID=UPI002952893F|nr:cytosol aminopeptidase [Ordospora pajunii]KAH9411369.1 cytosol aminopeptidase [Ordospora pajunii]